MCYDSYSMNVMNVDGGTNKFTTIVSTLDGARDRWNSLPSVFTLNKRPPDSWCTHWNTAANYGAGGAYAVTYTQGIGSTITDTDTEFNTYPSWSSSTTCVTSPANLRYVGTHEYGHWVKFNDVTSSPTDSIMWWSYNCSANTIRAGDSSELTSIYG